MEALEQRIDLLQNLLWHTRKARVAIDHLRVDITRAELDETLKRLDDELVEATVEYEEARS